MQYPGMYGMQTQPRQEMFYMMSQYQGQPTVPPPAAENPEPEKQHVSVPPAIPQQPSIPFSLTEQISGQPSIVDWQTIKLSPSPSNFFGISPMPSLGFGS
jgi:hypothetical protein